jgi:DNA-binding response OmpR family regulator
VTGALRSEDGAGVRGAPPVTMMSGRVLLIERDALIRCPLAHALRGAGLTVQERTDGAAALEFACSGRFDLLLVDIFVPSLGGLEGCRRIRNASDVPIVVMAERDSVADRVLGLEAGADDYIGKPFSMAELICRVRAILRRRQIALPPVTPVRSIGDIQIDFVAQRAVLDGETLSLTPTEFRLLSLLTQEPGRAFSAREILRHLWHSDYVGDEGACKAHISNLRQKIEPDPGRPRRVVTVRGVGYAYHST